MHVCFAAIDYHEGAGGGGIASYVDALGGELVRQGHRVTVLAQGRASSIREERGMMVLRTPLGSLHWYLYRLRAPSIGVLPVRQLEWSRSLRREMDRIMARHPIDIVEGHETGVLFLSGHLEHLPPLVVRFHGDHQVFARYSGEPITLGDRLSRRLQRYAWERAAAASAPSARHAAEIAGELGWSPDRVRVIPNPICPWLLDRAGAREPDRGTQRPGAVLYAGRIQRSKGTLSLLQSVPLVTRAVPTVEYVIAGGRHSSIDDRTLEAALGSTRVRDRVRLLGHVPRHDLPGLYRRAQIFVMPSYYETFSISVVEAMAFGLPVVATGTGGLPEVVLDGVTGILVPPGDSVALSEALIQLLQDAGLRRRLGNAGRERALAEFTVQRAVAATLDLYASLPRHKNGA